MATYPINQVIRGTIQWTLSGGQDAFNVLHFGTAEVGTVGQPQVDDAAAMMADLVQDAFATFRITAITADTVNIVAAAARTVDPTNPLQSTVPLALVGTGSGDALPFESAWVTTHYTELASRRGRGRTFMPGLANGYVPDGAMDATVVSQMTDLWDGWRAHVAADTELEFVVWSPTNNSARTVTSSLVRRTIHHQSSRNT